MSYYGLLWVTMSSDEFLWTSGIINKNIVTHRNLSEPIKFYSGDERDEETTTKLSIINSPCCPCCL